MLFAGLRPGLRAGFKGRAVRCPVGRIAASTRSKSARNWILAFAESG